MFKAFQEDQGRPHPALLKRVFPRPDCQRYLDAYSTLSSCRQWNDGNPQPIVLSEIYSHLEKGLGLVDYRTKGKYVRLIKALDAVELEHYKALKAKASR